MKDKLIMPFTEANDDPLYTHGFECGRVWAIMAKKSIIGNYAFHSANTEQFQIMAKALDYEIEIKPLDDTWSVLWGKPIDTLAEALLAEDYELAAKIRDKNILNGPNGVNTINMKADELALLEKINAMCVESLDPDHFEKWEAVQSLLKENRGK